MIPRPPALCPDYPREKVLSFVSARRFWLNVTLTEAKRCPSGAMVAVGRWYIAFLLLVLCVCWTTIQYGRSSEYGRN